MAAVSPPKEEAAWLAASKTTQEDTVP